MDGKIVTIPSTTLVLTLVGLVTKTSYNIRPAIKLVVFAAVIVKLITPFEASTINDVRLLELDEL
jgi:hypothetical protein